MIRTAERIAEQARIANSVYGPSRAAYVMARIAFWGALSAARIRHPWVKQRPNPATPRLLPAFKLFAVIGTWMEGDVVKATVKNAFAQGCERVFIIDNDSPDDTVEKAQLAGAELAGSYSTEEYDEHLRLRLMNEAVARISAEDGSEHIWWQFLDGDEFPHGPGGLTIREYLESLDEQYRIVGSRLINHYPGGEPHYVSGFHPLDFQPLCEELSGYRCSAFHLNHPLQRYDRDRPPIAASIGFHEGVSVERPLFEPSEAVYFHHFPFRQRAVTLERLRMLCAGASDSNGRAPTDDVTSAHMEERLRVLEAVYAHDWETVGIWVTPKLHWKRPRIEPVPWPSLVTAQDATFERWYSTEDLETALASRPYAAPLPSR